MNLLILGGTAFLGRAVATHALARGHSVTCAARGSAPAPEGCTFVPLDRDDLDGLAPVADRRWDAVVDLSRDPRHVARAVSDLDPAHWVLVSTANVYAGFDRREQAESSPTLAPLEDLDDSADYGRAKITCEASVRGARASSTVIRPGLIGGPGDASGRSGYYPWRFAHPTSTDVVVPDAPDMPVAMIDVDDLAAWIVDVAQRRLHGVYNATGTTTTLREALRISAEAARSTATPLWVDPRTLAEADVAPWMGEVSLPLWIDDPTWRWFATLDTTAARAEGLVTRPLAATIARALAYERSRAVLHGRSPDRAGLSDDDERRVRALALGGARGR
ncbi:NAD-dependent epimerase/dehydratase family protein [Demequina lignilytica]|uniref:NAD-dependent epimerase/dehydratase family protein n=1 Tax=Demequina lignilytica TaxID=3051663 RepID=A0AB35MJR5_9MICO|nr:NAD-dependent epimerase/dehydratase family protein [Demequina sp. SYSU T0a273]MDN4483945.1 NAD-dependent epimerase/dehydratase family protein [Demequina sp. SYSU T0a273]